MRAARRLHCATEQASLAFATSATGTLALLRLRCQASLKLCSGVCLHV